MNRMSRVAFAAVAAATVGLATVPGNTHERGGGNHPWIPGDGGHGMHRGHHEMGDHHAGYGPYGAGWGRAGRGVGMLETFDADGDGRLTQEEVDTVRADRLKEFDADGDGSLSLAEYEALWLDAMRERMVDRFQEHDADGDGKVTVEEFGRRYARTVRHMDVNGDGAFDRTDMLQRHRMRFLEEDEDDTGGGRRGPMHGGG